MEWPLAKIGIQAKGQRRFKVFENAPLNFQKKKNYILHENPQFFKNLLWFFETYILHIAS